MIEWSFTVLIIAYCLFILYLWVGWERITAFQNEDFLPSVAVIIPIRNEAANIKLLLYDLHKQTYTGELEIIIIDDHSEDDSKEIIEQLLEEMPIGRLISLQEKEGKKKAITTGIETTGAEIILTTDGDCRVPNTWVATMVHSFNKQTQLVSGPVKFLKEDSFFSQLQLIEFGSLIGSGAALIGWEKPLMANGANLAFRKSAFNAVNGFDGNLTTASGDDVFLLHKVAVAYKNGVHFAKQESAIVSTYAQPTIKSFIHQRIRWASKWKAYTDLLTKTTAVLVFVISLNLLAFPFLVGFNRESLFLWINLLLIKAFFDYFFIRQIMRFMDEKINGLAFATLQIVYPIYVVFTALFSFRKSYVWKGRKVK
ncbi:MAG: glycosyltransferase [Cyclobacteriaceae bacterium]|nr:glycosyltransferase [Cyclobacteriaceae bacterium]